MAAAEQYKPKESVLVNLPQDEWDKVKERVSELVMEDERLNLLMTCLIYPPRIYNLARIALRKEMSKRNIEWEEGVEEMMLQMAHAQTQQRYDRHDVLQKASSALVKFLGEDYMEEVESTQRQAAEEDAARKQALLSQGIDIPVSIDPRCVTPFQRGEVVVFYGPRQPLVTHLDEVREALSLTWGHKDPDKILRVLDLREEVAKNAAFPKRELGTKRAVNVGVNRWASMANKNSGIQEVLKGFYPRFVDQRVDVLFVRDGFQLFSGGLGSVHPAFAARDGLKRLKKWAEEQGVLALVCLPCRKQEEEELHEHVDRLLAPHYKVFRIE